MSSALQPPIRVWPWEEAPGEYRAFSRHGGDEDWVALVPHYLAADAINGRIGFLAPGSPFGVCDVSWHPQDDGAVVGIGAHA